MDDTTQPRAGHGEGAPFDGSVPEMRMDGEARAGAFDRFLTEQRFPRGSIEDLRFKLQRYLTLTARRWQTRLNQRLAQHGVTQSRWMALFWIHLCPAPPTQKQLAEQMGVEGPTLVRSLNALEEAGMVQRREVASDRRARTLHLTQKARSVLDQVTRSGDALRDEVLQDIRPEELEVCLSVLERIYLRLHRAGP